MIPLPTTPSPARPDFREDVDSLLHCRVGLNKDVPRCRVRQRARRPCRRGRVPSSGLFATPTRRDLHAPLHTRNLRRILPGRHQPNTIPLCKELAVGHALWVELDIVALEIDRCVGLGVVRVVVVEVEDGTPELAEEVLSRCRRGHSSPDRAREEGPGAACRGWREGGKCCLSGGGRRRRGRCECRWLNWEERSASGEEAGHVTSRWRDEGRRVGVGLLCLVMPLPELGDVHVAHGDRRPDERVEG